ncbi:MAG: hypothetical protein AB8B62_16305 [Roseobacter sp.]
MTQNEHSDLDAVERLLSRARGADDGVPRALSARILADALREQPVPAPIHKKAHVWQNWFGEFGGWPAFSGLVAASCVGFWIGISPPEGIGDPSAWLLDDTSATYDDAAELSGFGWDLQEG